MSSQVFIDQRIAESIRQRIGEQAGQAVEGLGRQRRKAIACADRRRHFQGRRRKTSPHKCRRVFELVVARLAPQRRDGAHLLAPEPHFDDENFSHGV